MPARAVEDQGDLLGGSGSCLARKGGEFGFEERDTDAGRQMEEFYARGGMHKVDEIAPGVAMLDRREGTLPDRRPDKAVATSLRSGLSFF